MLATLIALTAATSAAAPASPAAIPTMGPGSPGAIPAPSSVATPCAPGMAVASAQLRAADAATGRHDDGAADAALEAGLRALGDRYAAPPTADDTGMHLVVAASQKRHGHLGSATAIKRRVLAERLDLCRRLTMR